jgi:RNA recognition motif-containing protein
MQRDLDLQVPLATPQLSDLKHGGHKIGELRPRATRTEQASTRPAKHIKKREHGRTEASAPGSGKGANSIYVANLPWTHGDDELEALFAGHGKVHAATVIIDKRTGRSKGFGFVDMPQRSARRAIDALHGHEINGRDLTVRFAQPRKYGE